MDDGDPIASWSRHEDGYSSGLILIAACATIMVGTGVYMALNFGANEAVAPFMIGATCLVFLPIYIRNIKNSPKFLLFSDSLVIVENGSRNSYIFTDIVRLSEQPLNHSETGGVQFLLSIRGAKHYEILGSDCGKHFMVALSDQIGKPILNLHDGGVHAPRSNRN